MTQAITLHSQQFLNPFLILPQEILSLILEYISSDIVSTVHTLIAADSRMKNNLISSLRYVSKLSVVQTKLVFNCRMLRMFSGVKHLDIQPKLYLNLSCFNQNIWGNLEFLSISSEMIVILNQCWLNDIENECENQNPKSRKYEHCMYKLRSMNIYNKNNSGSLGILNIYNKNNSGSLGMMNVGKDICPELESLSLDECMIYNLQDFKGLRVVKIKNVEYRHLMFKLGMIDIEELYLDSEFECPRGLYIPSLRKLKIRCNARMLDMETLNRHDLTELTLINTFAEDCLDDSEDSSDNILLNIPSLRKLKIEGIYINLSKMAEYNLTELRMADIILDHPIYLGVLSLKKLVLRNTTGTIVGNHPNIEYLELFDSNLFPHHISTRMKKLTNLSISMSRNMDLGFKVDSSTFPNLRYLRLSGYANNIGMNLDNLLDIVVIRIQSPDYSCFPRYEESRYLSTSFVL